MIMGMLKPSRGQILLNGRPIQKSPEDFKMRVGYIPEEAVLYSHLSGYEYLQLVGRLRNLNERDMTLKIKALLRLCEVLPIV
jgi:ABC-2 type transport system ATP-binding protein